MKKAFNSIAIFVLSTVVCMLSCSSEAPGEEPKDELKEPGSDISEQVQLYDWEKNRTEMLNSTDMVLIYGGDRSREPYEWTTEAFEPYVKYEDQKGKSHWMFDAFVFLELGESEREVMYTYYTYDKPSYTSATKNDWKRLVDYYFSSNTGIGALNRAVANAQNTLGNQPKKRRVVIAIPEPIRYKKPGEMSSSTIYWGTVDGHIIDFSKNEDRIAACKWYVDYVRSKFNEMQYKNVELAGFYWLYETVDPGKDEELIKGVRDYLEKFKYNFCWAPFYKSTGHDKWDKLGFNTAYYQPNYFFNPDKSIQQLKDACQTAVNKNMDMEFEFDYRALTKNDPNGFYAARMRDYMSVFKEYKIWDHKFLAYYQGLNNFLSFKNSSDSKDQELYHDFCQFVITRPIRSK